MIRFKITLYVFIVITLVIGFFSVAKAQESFSGGQGSNLVVKTGIMVTQKQDMEVKLHAGFAEVNQTYLFKNEKNSLQEVVFGFPYQQGSKDTGVDNITISVDNLIINPSSNKEVNGNIFTYWKLFETAFEPNQTKQIQISYWQTNGANLRGLRSFNYALKNKLPGQIKQFNLKLYLMDSLNIDQFNKSLNPDLDLKLEPLGWKNIGSALVWQWSDFTPGFDLKFNFYWPNSDLAKIGDLNKNIGLYNIKTSTNQTNANSLVDSSYLTNWEVTDFNSNNKPKININFDQLTEVEEIRMIPGKADSLDNFASYARPKEILLTFDQNQTQLIKLDDELKMQTLKLPQAINTQNVSLRIESIYPGKINPNTLALSEIEFGKTLPQVTLENPKTDPEKPHWQQFFINIYQKIIDFFSRIF